MVNTRSTDVGLITNPVPLEIQVATLTTNVNQITQMLQEIQARLNNGEGPNQRRENKGQMGQHEGQNGNNGGNNRGAYNRLTKIEFPKFEGDDVLSWLYRVNKFYEMDHIDDDAQKIRLVSMHMFRKALNWHKHFMTKHGAIMTWDLYQTHVKKRFESVFEDQIVALKNLKQTNIVQVYQESFKDLLNKYTLGHKCSGKLYSLEVIKEGLDDEEDRDMQLTEEGVINWNIARKLGCKLRKMYPLEVFVENGMVMSSKCDFKNLVMEYTYNNKKVVLRGTKQATIQWMQGKQRQGKKLVSAKLSAMSVCVCPTTFMQIEAGSYHSKDVETVLKDFELVFDVPKELPHKRTHDHSIPLMPNTPQSTLDPISILLARRMKLN
nr:hypothetical protein [Tanacetum cinerariifolium]